MCGFIFQKNTSSVVDKNQFDRQLKRISWRGPDVQNTIVLDHGKLVMGHCRLSILDLHSRSDQPMVSECGRFYILLNGEIYNHNILRKELGLNCKTTSDTETVLCGYVKLGNDIFSQLDGMFSIVIYDSVNNKWVAARDAFGIKPLYISHKTDQVIISSEAATIAQLIRANPSEESIAEWEIIRRPLPGYSFFEGVNEILPGTILNSDGTTECHWHWTPSKENFDQQRFEGLLNDSIVDHCLSDVKNVSLLSGGLDSALIAKLSNAETCYTVGMPSNNEFEGAQESANSMDKELKQISLTPEELKDHWRFLTRLRGEPLGLPNEGLIYHVCNSMDENEKVVLTGEGADELLFGYDGIFRWCLNRREVNTKEFLLKYGYSAEIRSQRLVEYVDNLKKDKSSIEFLEDFFYQVHLPGLLRRMDFASMAASKEARVPFVCKKLISYLYRQPSSIKINDKVSKIPIRKFAEKLSLFGALGRKKIGFSATLDKTTTRLQDYAEFRKIILEELAW